MTATAVRYTLIPAPGYYGDWLRVGPSYRTLAGAAKAAREGGTRIVTGCHRKKGEVVAAAAVNDLLATGNWKVCTGW